MIIHPYGDKKKGHIINVADEESYSFNDIIDTFLKSNSHPTRPVVRIPTYLIFLLTRMMGLLFSSKKAWIYGCHEKLASSLIFDNKRMLEKGFKPEHNLKTIFL